MDNPMPDAGELGLTADMDGAAVVNRRDRALVIIAGDRLLGGGAPLRVRYREARCCPYSPDPPMSRGRERSVGPGLEHREFDARRAGIDHEDRFVHALDLAGRGGHQPSFAPGQEQADVARHAAREIEYSGSKPETIRFQIALPPETDFRRLAAQGARPTGFGPIDCPAAVAAQLGWEAEQHEFLFAVLRRLARLVHQATPAFVGDVAVNQLCHLAAALFRR